MPPEQSEGAREHAKPQMLIVVFFLIAVFFRFSKILPNLEFVTTSMVMASIYLGRKYALILVLAVMAATDTVLGNTSIFLFTWSGFLLPAFVVSSRFQITNLKYKFLSTLALALSTNLFFFIWTNFGVWALDSWGMYPKTFPGLVSCYINALPFLKTQVLSTLLFLPASLIIFRLLNCRSSSPAFPALFQPRV